MANDAGVEAQRSAAMLLLFLPMVPMIFMGEEWSASSPFLYFTDYGEKLGDAITKGRREEFSSFKAFSDPGTRDKIPDPQSVESFTSSRLPWDERANTPHSDMLGLYKRMGNERVLLLNCGKEYKPIPPEYAGKEVLVGSRGVDDGRLSPFGAVVISTSSR